MFCEFDIFKKGKLDILVEMVKDKTLSVEDAANIGVMGRFK